jgi:hypothetical protein
MRVLRQKRRLSLTQAWNFLNNEDVFGNCKPLWDAARAKGSKKPWITFIQEYCKRIVTATRAPPDVPNWAARLDEAKYLAEHGYPRGGKVIEPPPLTNLEVERYGDRFRLLVSI